MKLVYIYFGDPSTLLFIVAVFTLTQKYIQSGYPATDTRIMKMWCPKTVMFDPEKWNHKIYRKKWISLESIMLSEVIASERWNLRYHAGRYFNFLLPLEIHFVPQYVVVLQNAPRGTKKSYSFVFSKMFCKCLSGTFNLWSHLAAAFLCLVFVGMAYPLVRLEYWSHPLSLCKI